MRPRRPCEHTALFDILESGELLPEGVGVPRREDRDLAVDVELHALDRPLPSLHDDAMTVNADAALLRRLKVIPILALAPAKVLEVGPFAMLQGLVRIETLRQHRKTVGRRVLLPPDEQQK